MEKWHLHLKENRLLDKKIAFKLNETNKQTIKRNAVTVIEKQNCGTRSWERKNVRINCINSTDILRFLRKEKKNCVTE